jgi:GH24 family phage-related lysozyme (muramidase)
LLFIQGWEKLVLTPYNAGDGFKTVGWGHVLTKGEAIRRYTEDECVALLRKDLRIAEDAVCRLITVPLTDNQFAALVSLTFNGGAGLLQRSVLRMRLNRYDYAGAKRAFLNYTRSNGIRLKGLVRRRIAESKMFGA